jgi:DNA-binding beta-propeller fold protein YncE
VFLFCRGEHPVMVYERDGTFVRAWGEGIFTMRAHGVTVAPDDTLWFTDDGDQTVRKFTREGELLMTLGTSGRPSETGYDGKDHGSVQRAAGPFNRPTNVAIAANGDLYVSDGYGNARVHRFSSKGELIRSWGQPGSGPGEFRVPHGIAIHADGRVFVCDRENDRVQIFSPEGEFLSEWTTVRRPTQIVFDGHGRAIVGELTWRAGQTSFRLGPIKKTLPSRVAMLDTNGTVLARLGDEGPYDETWGAADPCRPGNFCAPHDLALDPETGDLYVAEVTYTIGVSKNLVPATCHTIQKFKAVS